MEGYILKLNLDVIHDNLPISFQTQLSGRINRELSIKPPFLYEVGCEFEKDRLYVAQGDTLPKRPSQRGLSIICVDLRPPQEWISAGCSVLTITSGQSLYTVFNEINRIYEKFEEWDNSLRNELEADVEFDIKNVLRVGMTILQNPMSVINGSMLVILHTEIRVNKNNEIEILVSDESFSHPVEHSVLIKNACKLENAIPTPFISSCTVDGKRSYCNNLYPLGYFSGCISISELNRPFRESDFALADYFFHYFQKSFMKYLQRICNIELPGIVALNKMLKNIPLSIEEQKILLLKNEDYWIFFKLRENIVKNPLPMNYLCTTLSTLRSESIYSVIYDNEIMGLLKVSHLETDSYNNTLDFFQEILYKLEYIAGISDEFQDINKIHNYIRQADFAIEVGQNTCELESDENRLFYFSDFALRYIMCQCNGEFSAEYLYPKGLRKLIEYDASKNTNYVETLDSYLKNEMRATNTADELFLHRSSLLKRLNKISKILNSDLEDPDFRLHLRICLHQFKRNKQ